MAVPTFSSIAPNSGPAGGRSTAIITGSGFRLDAASGKTVLVEVDGVLIPFTKMGVLSDTQIRIEVPAFARRGAAAMADPLPPVNVRIVNLDSSGVPIAGEEVTGVDAYTHQRAPILGPAATLENQHYYQVIVETINTFQRQVLVNTAIGTSVDYGEFGEVTISDAKLPAIGLGGPRFEENLQVRHQWMDLPAEGDGGELEEFQKKWHGYIVDLEFDLVIGAKRRAETYALAQAVIELFLRTQFIEIPVDSNDPGGDKHQFPLVLLSPPNVGFEDKDADVITATGLFQVRWVPIRLPEAFQIGTEVIDGSLIVSKVDDQTTVEVVPFADKD